MTSWLLDLRHAARTLLRTPAFTAGVVLTLGLGLGLSAVMVTLLDRLLWQAPTGVVDAERLSRLYIETRVGTPEVYASTGTQYPVYTDLRAQPGAFADLAAVARRSMVLGEGVDRRRIDLEVVSGNFFELVGTHAAIGRLFTEADDSLAEAPMAVITWAFWQREFGGSPEVLGRTIRLEDRPYTVIGVTARGFAGLNAEPTDVFLPIVQNVALGTVASASALTSRRTTWLMMVGRLRAGVSRELAGATATTVYRDGMRGEPGFDSTARILAGPIQEYQRPVMSKGIRQSVWITLAAGAVLLIACVNITNLLLARGMTREKELAIRASLGAGRRGLARVILSESVVLSLAGGLFALLAALWGGAALRTLVFPWLPEEAILSPKLFVVLGIGVVVTTVLTGVIPVLQLSRFDLARGLRRATRGATGAGQQTRDVLLAGQIGLTLLLLVGAGLFLRSLQRALAIDPGMRGDLVYEVSPRLIGEAFREPEQVAAFYHELLARLQRLPGIAGAALTRSQPFATAQRATGVRVEGEIDTLPQSRWPYLQAVTPDYHTVVGTTLLRGRLFGAGDVIGAEPVAIVNTAMADAMWPGREAIGRCLYRGGGGCTRVVGVAVNAKRMGLTDDAAPLFYVPLAQEPIDRIDGLYLRMWPGVGDPELLVRQVMETMPGRPFTAVYSLAERIADQRSSWLHAATIFSLFSLLGLLLAAVGTFSVLSYGVTQRTREIGVRVALGARDTQVVRMVVRQGVMAALAGMLCGGVGAWFFAHGIGSLLYEVPPSDPLVFGGTMLVLLVVTIAAGWLPARRAARIDPMAALRGE